MQLFQIQETPKFWLGALALVCTEALAAYDPEEKLILEYENYCCCTDEKTPVSFDVWLNR